MSGVELQVRQYDAGARQPPHYDGCSRVSVLLRGDVWEETRSGEIRLQSGEVLIKSGRVKHETRFGDRPARIASICFADIDVEPQISESAWTPKRGVTTLRLGWAMAQAISAGDARAALVAATDLLADAPGQRERVASVAPAWLSEIRDELVVVSLRDIDVGARAAAAGVHPVHVSRQFRACYGLSLTEFAQTQAARRALASLENLELRLSEVAAQAGFYDQSHMNRVFRDITALTPGEVRSVLVRTSRMSTRVDNETLHSDVLS